MTVIIGCVRDRVLAADTFCTGYRVSKLFRTKAKGIFGCAGDDTAIARFEDWLLRKGRKPEQVGPGEDFEALQLHRNVLYIWGKAMRAERLLTDFHAVGSGGPYALAVLKHGGTVQEALDIAAFYDGDCKPPFTMETE